MGGSGGARSIPRCAPMDGMISWWHGDDDYDDAVGSNDGLTAGAVTFAPGIDHEGFNLNGTTGSFVEVPDDASLDRPAEFTIDAWINTPVLGGRIFDKITAVGNDGYLLDLIGDHLRGSIGNVSMGSADAVPAGHVGARRRRPAHSTGMKLYINGVPDGDDERPRPRAGQQPSAAHRRGRQRRQPVHGRDRRAADLRARASRTPRSQTLFWQGTQLPVGRDRAAARTLTTICRRLAGRRRRRSTGGYRIADDEHRIAGPRTDRFLGARCAGRRRPSRSSRWPIIVP